MNKILKILAGVMVFGITLGVTGAITNEVKAEDVKREQTLATEELSVRGRNEIDLIENLKERLVNDESQFENKNIYIDEINNMLSYLPDVIEESKVDVGDTMYQYVAELNLRNSIEKLSTLKTWLENLEYGNNIDNMDIQILLK